MTARVVDEALQHRRCRQRLRDAGQVVHELMWIEVSEPASEFVPSRPRSFGDDSVIENDSEQEGEGVLEEKTDWHVRRENGLAALLELSSRSPSDQLVALAPLPVITCSSAVPAFRGEPAAPPGAGEELMYVSNGLFLIGADIAQR